MVRVYGGLRVVKVAFLPLPSLRLPGLLASTLATRERLAQGMQFMDAMLFIILIVLLVLALGGGGWAHSRYGYVGWSPAGLLLLLVVVLWLTGGLRY
jgi:hypothetical protein